MRTQAVVGSLLIVCRAAAVDYPQWRGADGSGATTDSGVKCVEDLSQIKLVWESEAYLPNSYDDQYRDKEEGADGGFTAHSLYDGKLYVQYSVPSGDLQDKNRLETFAANKQVQEFSKVWADDVILCMDAKTGKTLWKQTYAGKGCHAFRLLGLVHTQPAIQDGKVYAVGSLGRIYCLDAKTGAPVWETTVGPGHEWAVKAIEKWAADQAKDDWKKHARDARTIKVLGKNDHGTLFTTLMPQLAGDVLVVNTGYQGDLAAFDLKTGKQRWYKAGVATQKQSPTVWRSGDKYYVLHASGNGKEGGALVCTDAATGERAWLVEDAPTNPNLGPVVSGPYIVVQGSTRYGKGGTTLSCFKADGKGATRVWSMPPDLAPSCPSQGHRYIASVIYRITSTCLAIRRLTTCRLCLPAWNWRPERSRGWSRRIPAANSIARCWRQTAGLSPSGKCWTPTRTTSACSSNRPARSSSRTGNLMTPRVPVTRWRCSTATGISSGGMAV
jgi:outer membrane protein assembly factor BamB